VENILKYYPGWINSYIGLSSDIFEKQSFILNIAKELDLSVVRIIYVPYDLQSHYQLLTFLLKKSNALEHNPSCRWFF
jgi:hypothetical protein